MKFTLTMKSFYATVFFLIGIVSTAQNPNRTFLGYEKKANILEIKTQDGYYRLLAYSDKIVETSFIPNGETYRPESQAVVMTPENISTVVIETDENLQFKTDGIAVTIQKAPFQIQYFYKNKLLISEKSGYIKTDSLEVLEFNLKPDEALYGGGARALGFNRRGHRLQLYNRAHYGYENHAELMNFTLPLVLSSDIYAVHFDNAPIGFLDLDSQKDNRLRYETISGRKTYQVIATDDWKQLIENYTTLTGKQPLPPRWALGNFSSRFGYHSQREVEATIAKFKAENIPVDAVILDLYWFGKEIQGTLGNFEFLKDSFPNPEKMIKDLSAQGIKTILITEPFVLTTSKKWQEAVDKKILAVDSLGKPFVYDFYFGNTGLIDIFKKEGHDWFWNIYEKYTEMGVSGWWGDLGEPEAHPSGLIHATGTADELHNVYGHNWARLIFDGYRKDFPNQRPFILMRAGYSGSQRFGMIPWSGDVNRSWGGLQSQTEIALEMGMQGLGYMHSDLGGFAGANDDPELYTRWLQYGVFQPVFRPHAQEEVASEPVFKDPETKALAKQAIELRYRMLPYNYSLAFENHLHGTPLMRPLLFEEPTNEALLTESKTYLWGDAFLVSPVVNPGIETQNIYFPKSADWFDFYTGKKYEAGQTYSVQIVDNHIPTFVRAGAFVPMARLVQNTNDYTLQSFELHFYHDSSVASSEGMLYNDDGLTPEAFEKGKYEILRFHNQNQANSTRISIETETGKNFVSSEKNIALVIHRLDKKPKKVLIDGKKTTFEWDETGQKLTIKWILKSNQQTVVLRF
ncbi:MAG: glycosyl hydrolase [Bacteroidetes bacterium HGW-Bacteroidetes-13]|nr:MAG: glycosyl hydrolase [Bacteroidetes bacterium HGW-Bacteroidetes-13]